MAADHFIFLFYVCTELVSGGLFHIVHSLANSCFDSNVLVIVRIGNNQFKMDALGSIVRFQAAKLIKSLAVKLSSGNSSRSLSTQVSQILYLLQNEEKGLSFIRSNPRPPKLIKHAVTEIRKPRYSTFGKR